MTVFIGIPTYNRPHLVVEAIESLRRQSFADFEVVVSDNCSERAAREQVRKYVEDLRDSRFRFHQQSFNGGEYGQGRYFLGASAGKEYLMILHDDDVIAPDLLRMGVRILDDNPVVSLFVANCWVINEDGETSAEWTRQYLSDHGRLGRPAGTFDILDHHLATGFTPVSGTLLRRSSLLQSGFVDPQGEGNFPFECDLFLRLGDISATGWFTPAQLMSVRYHEGALRRTLRLMDNPAVVRPMLRLFQQRRYSGWRERRRRIVLSRLQRADALIRLREGDRRTARKLLGDAVRSNALSPKAWGARTLAWASPDYLASRLPNLPLQEPRAGAVSSANASLESRDHEEDILA